MTFRNVLLASLPVVALFSVSCSDDDSIQEPGFDYTVPSTYTFERNGTSTVEYGGQTNRILMLDAMGNYIKNQAAADASVDVAKLYNMYSNSNTPFDEASLNAATDKQLKNKTAASRDFFVNFQGGGSTTEQVSVRNFFETQLTNAGSASGGVLASEGVAGVYQDGSSKRLFAADGLEPQQVLLKGMMGACFLDQVVNNYLSTAVLDEGSNRDNNTNKVLETGKNYTKMEHLWDEAYGYVYGADDLTAAIPVYKFWSSYINQVDADSDFGTLKEDLELAFRKGRAAIVAGDYATRDAQIAIIKQKLALVSAVRAVFYLKEGKAKLVTDSGKKAFHALSEGYGFIMSLRYTNKPATNAPYMSKAEVDAVLSELMGGTNGLYDVDYLNVHIDDLAADIATRFGFTVEQAQTVN
ncbi:hypothetical protein FSS13T_06920 [Flavobacterium saliperosum S13]|uniref:DUF4856 domain-containing protein n=2 Tax=Flavobacterium saliperosum TaxID=329186 RepID=A0A1G4VZW0_9FLAO|nr:DUF4856 domain-containing protein [Flavobacterium saliperosum]ESU27433.1 hypothetical protein FSS13T_06920 [Flavobacterium saliperosum S13]SCX14482.1 protein of unknown function [Flavobacterium saliperosum]